MSGRKIVLKKSHAGEWWGRSNGWTTDEAQAMVFPTISEAVDCGLVLGSKDVRVVVVGIPVPPSLLNACEPRRNRRTVTEPLQAC